MPSKLAPVAALATATALAGSLAIVGISSGSDGGALAPGTPVLRSIEHGFNRASQEPGPFKEIGYLTYVRGLSVQDLFDAPPGSTELNESNARFSVVQDGELVATIPNASAPPRPGDNNSFGTATARGPERIYYDPHPERDWTRPETFATGELVAVWDTTASTNVFDLSAGVGTGVDEGARSFSKEFTLASGKTYDFARLGSRVTAHLQLQLRTGLTSPFPEMPVVSVDSELWQHVR